MLLSKTNAISGEAVYLLVAALLRVLSQSWHVSRFSVLSQEGSPVCLHVSELAHILKSTLYSGFIYEMYLDTDF